MIHISAVFRVSSNTGCEKDMTTSGTEWRTIGHEKAISSLSRSMAEDRVSHAYLLLGPRQVGKMTLALDIARMVNCQSQEKPCGQCRQCRRITESLHADVRIVAVESRSGRDGNSRTLISVDDIGELQKEASLKPYEGRHRVFIIDGADYLSDPAANRLLKTLEEPPDDVIFILLASDAGAMLPTIVSRCQQLELRPLPLDQVAGELHARYGADHETALEVARLSGGKPGWALEAMSKPETLERRSERLVVIEETLRGGLQERFAYAEAQANAFSRSRETVARELQLWREWWRDALVIKEGATDFVTNLSRLESLKAAAEELSSAQITSVIKAVQETMELLERNVNARLALEQLMLALPRI
jgi:DNA polymerase-3 subunit delta'